MTERQSDALFTDGEDTGLRQQQKFLPPGAIRSECMTRERESLRGGQLLLSKFNTGTQCFFFISNTFSPQMEHDASFYVSSRVPYCIVLYT